MSLAWSSVKALSIPVAGVSRDVKRVSVGGTVLWEKPNPLPYDAEVEYLESTGTQYIDTGVKMRNYLSFDAEFVPTGNSPEQRYDAIYGVYNSTDINVASLSCIVPADITGNGYGNRYMEKSISVPTSPATYKNKRVFYHQANDSFTVSIDGQTIDYGAINSTQIAESAETIRIFGIYYTGANRYAKARMYSFQIRDNGVLVRDLIPVRVGSGPSAVGYLYDKANPTGGPLGNGLYPNAGRGAFVVGPDANA